MKISKKKYGALLILISGVGGLLYGVDVGIIAAALPYLNATINLSVSETSLIVAAVLGGSMLSSLAAGFAADWWGRKTMMIASSIFFLTSIAVIASANGFKMLFFGRLLQGISGGVIAVVVPLYLAECLDAKSRGRGSAFFQFMLTLGIVLASAIGFFYTHQTELAAAAAPNNLQAILASQKHAWRSMFLTVAYPGAFFLVGSLFLSESPRWLLRKGKTHQAFSALLRSLDREEAEQQMMEMHLLRSETSSANTVAEGLFQRRYVVPFLLACAVLVCNQATGINSILSYLVVLLKRGGMSSTLATQSDFWVKVLNCLMTLVATALVDRRGRKFLLVLGTAGACIALGAESLTFQRIEAQRHDVRTQVQANIRNNSIDLPLSAFDAHPLGITVLYNYGDGVHSVSALSTDPKPFLTVEPGTATKPLVIEAAYTNAIPPASTGWLLAGLTGLFIASFAIGPGVVVWLALSELMPTRIRSTGMGIALLLNQAVSTLMAGLFLPVSSHHGYSAIFAFWSACTCVYFLIALLFVPETRGRTLEEVEMFFINKTKERTV